MKIAAFTATVMIPGIGVEAILTNRRPTAIHTTQKSSALMETPRVSRRIDHPAHEDDSL